ncbi:hypothetical protein AVEN_251907-1 [Araneus ventricosus]|uniref:Uncharacterized protein n=1 Tax=Araneus ventricosus TaxID=182803 RepID=A0A4Y2H2U3_ARAVE|nr:hypothetical protein AVEN_251907-1 [Araneus ventricosus]
MAVLPPLERTVLQSRESDADAEMSSSLSEEDALEYDMSEDLEDSPAVNSPPPSSKPQKGDKYKNSLAKNGSCAIKPQPTNQPTWDPFLDFGPSGAHLLQVGTGVPIPRFPGIFPPFQFTLPFAFCFPLLTFIPRLPSRQLSMRSCCRSVCFLLLMDSKIPPRVGRAWRPFRRVVHFGPRCINRPVSQPLGWSAQGDQAKGSLLGLGIKGGHCPRG